MCVLMFVFVDNEVLYDHDYLPPKWKKVFAFGIVARANL